MAPGRRASEFDSVADSPSWTSNRGVDYGEPSWVLNWNRMYAGDLPLADPTVSPINADCSGLPPLLVVAGAVELAVDDAQALVAKARAAGVRADLVLGADMVHAYVSFGAIAPRADEAMRAIAAFIESPERGAA